MYVLTNLSDEKLNELGLAVYDERRRRISLVADTKYPKLSLPEGSTSVDAVKLYRETYGVGLSEAHHLFTYHHRRT